MTAVEEIKQRIDIVDLVSQYAALKRTGKTYVARCPFHSERTPSFHVDPARQTWHCFGACSTGGDIFNFIMKKEACEFRDALRILGERAGVEVERRRDTQEAARRGRFFEINEAAAAFFHACLIEPEGPYSERAETARTYLEERRVASAAVEAFQLGYAPNSWDALTTFLGGRAIDGPEVVAAGLAIDGERGPYDRFRHRLMFPIRDERGRIAGFGGRLLPGDALGAGDVQPKYVNTAQSPIFDKGSILYGLDRAKEAIRSEGRAVIVEGYMDVIAAHEHGYTNVIASMGTALTERQVSIIKRHASTIILALDSDNAGSEATIRSAYEIVNSSLRKQLVPTSRGMTRADAPDIDLRVLSLPEKDPDEVIRNDPARWPDLVAAAPSVLDYLFEVTSARHELTTPDGRSAAVRALLVVLGWTADRVVQAHYLQRLARLAQVDEATLRAEMRQREATRRERRPAVDVAPGASTKNVRERKEEFCLALLIRYPVLRTDGAGLDPELFGQSENRALFESWVGRADTGESFGRSLTPDLRPHYERIASLDLPAYDDDTVIEAFRSTVWGIEQQRLRLAKRVTSNVVAELGASDNAVIAERAHLAWESGVAATDSTAEDEADPATAFVEDMDAGLKVHRRLLDQRSAGRSAGRGGE
jgi:DNA primase